MKQLLHTLFFFLLVTQLCVAQWVQVGLEDKTIKDIAARNSNIFAITSDIGSLYRSTNNGINWLQIIDSTANDIAVSPSGSVFMVKTDSLLYKQLHISTDNGNTWEKLNVLEQLPPPPPFRYPFIENISISNSGNIFCGIRLSQPPIASGTAFALSFDEGLSWTTPGWDTLGGILFDFREQYVITVGEFHSTGGGGGDDVYLSSDYGITWSLLGSWPEPYPSLLCICLNGSILYGCSPGTSGFEGGIFLSSNSCSTWTKVSTLIPQAGLSIESGGMLAGTDSLGVFLFSDNGDSLGSRNDGLANLNIHTLTIDNNNFVYAGTDQGVWRRPVSEVTSVEGVSITLPADYNLYQNFPNPFNPITKIKYSIPQSSNVVIKVFDVLGNEIETLVNEEKPAGTYEVTWYAGQLPSGVYFYQLKAGEFIVTKKMLLLK
jgi:hypothetical protein